MATPTYDLLDSVTLSSSASSVTFSGISGDYRDLIVAVDLPSSASVVVAYIKLNGVGTGYSAVGMEGNGSTASSFTSSPSGIESAVGDSGSGGIAITQIMDYAQTDKHKSVLVRQGNASNAVRAYAFRWANTAAVTSLDVDGSNPFVAGSKFAIYGVAA